MHNTLHFSKKEGDRMVLGKITGWAFAMWVWSHLVPVAPFLMITVGMVIADLISGVIAAKHRKEAITSSGLRRTIYKLTLYCTSILAARAMDVVFFRHIPGDIIDMTFIVAGLIALTEFKSLLENTRTVTGVDFWLRISEQLPNIWELFKNKK